MRVYNITDGTLIGELTPIEGEEPKPLSEEEIEVLLSPLGLPAIIVH